MIIRISAVYLDKYILPLSLRNRNQKSGAAKPSQYYKASLRLGLGTRLGIEAHREITKER